MVTAMDTDMGMGMGMVTDMVAVDLDISQVLAIILHKLKQLHTVEYLRVVIHSTVHIKT